MGHRGMMMVVGEAEADMAGEEVGSEVVEADSEGVSGEVEEEVDGDDGF